MVRAGETRCELIIGVLDSPCVKGMVLWATASIGSWFLIGGTGRGVFQWSGRYTDEEPLVRALEESCARLGEREGKDAWRRAVAGFVSGGEQTTQSAARLYYSAIRRATRERQDFTARIVRY